MIPTTRRRTLTLAAPEAPGRPAHVSAASGLVRAGDWLYVVADDALHLAVFPATGDAPGHTVRLFPGELPQGHAERKAAKPDLEALCRLGPSASFAHGALLALPSGSTPARRRASVLPLNADGTLAGEPRTVDCTSLYTQLERELVALNVEGAAVAGKRLRLLNRGNGEGGVDALVDLDLDRVLGSLDAGVMGPEAVRTVRRWELGEANGVRLSFTDASPLPDGRVVFTATAEASRDRVADGPVKGSAVGVLAPDGTPVYLDAVDAPVKLEGVDARVEGGRVHVLLVADADDPSVPAPLLEAALPVPG
ncbi:MULTISPECIES: DUF6929 family protein [unclassified Corallococcus]|uniref:DUF6929 family protein n=1 Tax=unclassified Corallococcus TaxID=2685029 RepID=UPI001A90B34B|nr:MULTISPECIES: hypothetical protein [unclassified Corallococcus]MBN9681903.1 hypothetical protein [Corallococcus sp. NCSPR001]WAS86530.1 hypothetical protein O0N60_06030 [Corallococcus sp. NCRR]